MLLLYVSSVQFSSVTQSCPTLCDPINRSTPGLPVHHQLLEFTQTHVHRVGDAIQPSHPLSSPSPPAPSPSQHQGLFQWVNSLHEVAKVLEFQPQHFREPAHEIPPMTRSWGRKPDRQGRSHFQGFRKGQLTRSHPWQGHEEKTWQARWIRVSGIPKSCPRCSP